MRKMPTLKNWARTGYPKSILPIGDRVVKGQSGGCRASQKQPITSTSTTGVYGKHFTREDDRKDYGEVRLVTAGMLRERMVVMGKTSNV